MNLPTEELRMCYMRGNAPILGAKDNFYYRKSSVCRRLFCEEQIDREETLRDLREVLEAFQSQQEQKWNFNFRDAEPMNGNFVWSMVTSHDCHDDETTLSASMNPVHQTPRHRESRGTPTSADIDFEEITFENKNRINSELVNTDQTPQASGLQENFVKIATLNRGSKHQSCGDISDYFFPSSSLLSSSSSASTSGSVNTKAEDRLTDTSNLNISTCSHEDRTSKRLTETIRGSRRKDRISSRIVQMKRMKHSVRMNSRPAIKNASIRDYFPVSKKAAVKSVTCSSGKMKSTR